jgi:predicted nucleic acid-binding protein
VLSGRIGSRRVLGLLAIVDAAPLYASVDPSDVNHQRCRAILLRRDLELVVPTLVITEVTYFLGRRRGPRVEAAFLRSLAELAVEPPLPQDWSRMADLVERYADFPLGTTDASVIALAERLNTDVVVTLDRRHFAAIKPRYVSALTLLPE